MNTADNTNGTTASDTAVTQRPTAGSQASSSAHGGVPVLTVRGLTKTYGAGETAVDAVRSVDLDVASGEVLLVMGPSGSGKTTLLLMLGALLRPTSGSTPSRAATAVTWTSPPHPRSSCRLCALTPSGSSSRTTPSWTR